MPDVAASPEISNPRRILAVSLEQEANHLSRVLKGESRLIQKLRRICGPSLFVRAKLERVARLLSGRPLVLTQVEGSYGGGLSTMTVIPAQGFIYLLQNLYI